MLREGEMEGRKEGRKERKKRRKIRKLDRGKKRIQFPQMNKQKHRGW